MSMPDSGVGFGSPRPHPSVRIPQILAFLRMIDGLPPGAAVHATVPYAPSNILPPTRPPLTRFPPLPVPSIPPPQDTFYEKADSLVGVCRDLDLGASRTFTFDLARFEEPAPDA